MWDLYKVRPAFVLGCHGCDEAVAKKVIAGDEQFVQSKKKYDWLGTGVYFWEASPHRAMEWAQDMAMQPSTSPRRVQTAAVIGAIYSTAQRLTNLPVGAWGLLDMIGMEDGSPVPGDKGDTPDRLGRFRDRTVIEFMHTVRERGGLSAYDTVRAAFPEGGELFPQAGFTKRSHIQIAVRNPHYIKAYFKPIPAQT